MSKNTTYIIILYFCFGTAYAKNQIEESVLTHSHNKDLTWESNKVKLRQIEKYRNYLGKIDVDPNKSSHLNPRYPGVVRSVSKSVGDTVKSGEVLATITNNVGLQTYSLRANLAGKIIHRKLAVGEYIDEDRLAFSIANLEKMWVDITIRQNDLKFFKLNQEVIILNRSRKRDHTTGKIFYISPVVDQHTMSATATVEILNPEGQWKPGQYVDCYIVIGNEKSEITVDNRSVIKQGKEAFVYKVNAKGKFQKQIIKLDKSDLHHSQILDGLTIGDEVSMSPTTVGIDEIVQADDDHGHEEAEKSQETHGDHDDHDENEEEHNK